MRLSEWRAEAPGRTAVEPKVLAVLEPVLTALGAGRDPHGWVSWGDDPAARWQYLAPTGVGLVVAFVRVNVACEGPRVPDPGTKLAMERQLPFQPEPRRRR